MEDERRVRLPGRRMALEAMRERDEARELAREIYEWYDGMEMHPDWKRKHPWLEREQPIPENSQRERMT